MTPKELILSKTNSGLDVFAHYFGENIKKTFCNPYRQDSSPSCKIYYRKESQRYILKDFGSPEWNGDCFKLVSNITGLNLTTQFVEILQVIDKELNLCCLNDHSFLSQEYKPLEPRETFIKKNPLPFTAVCRNFTSSEVLYWNQYGINLQTLERYNVKSIDKCHFTKPNKKYTVYGTYKAPAFGYMFNQGKGIKVYRPKSENRFLYGGVLPYPYIFGYEQLPDTGDTLYITGGEKDVLSLASHNFNAICFNSETAIIPKDILSKLSLRFNEIIFLYDSDETGVRESNKRVSEALEQGLNNVFRVHLPLAGTKKEKDISDYFYLQRTANDLQELTVTSKER